MALVKKKKSAFEDALDLVGKTASNFTQGAAQTASKVANTAGSLYNAFSKGLNNYSQQQAAAQERQRQANTAFTKGVLNAGKTAVGAVASAPKKVANYFDATYDNDANKAGVQNFWNNNPLHIASGLGNLQQRLQTGKIVSDFKPFRGKGVASTVGNFGVNLPGAIVNSVYGQGITAPTSDVARSVLTPLRYGQDLKYNEYNSGVGKLGLQIAAGINPQRAQELGVNMDARELIGNLGQAATPIADAWGGGELFKIGKAGLQSGGKQILSNMLKAGSNVLLPGLSSVAASQLSANRGKGSVKDQVKQTAIDTALAAPAIFAGGAIFHGVGVLGAKIVERFGPKVGNFMINKKPIIEYLDGTISQAEKQQLDTLNGRDIGTGEGPVWDTLREIFPQHFDENGVPFGSLSDELRKLNIDSPDEAVSVKKPEIPHTNANADEAPIIQPEEPTLPDLPESVLGQTPEPMQRTPDITPGNVLDNPASIIDEQRPAPELLTAEDLQPNVLAEAERNPEVQMLKEEMDQALSDTGTQIVDQGAQSTAPTAPVDFDMTTKEAEGAIKSMLGDAELEYVTGGDKILTEDGQVARGKYYDSIISVVENAGKVEKKTLYHEAFHAYIDKFADKSLYKSALDDLMQMEKYTKQQADEILAEGFADYAAGRREGFTGAVLNFFSDLMLSIRNLMGKVDSAELLYNSALRGQKAAEGGINLTEPAYRVKQEDQAAKVAEEPVTNPEDPFYNVKRMGISEADKKAVKEFVESPEVKGKVEDVVGDPVTFEEIKLMAKVSKELKGTKTRKDAVKLGAEVYNLRNKVAELSQLGLNNEQFMEALVRDKAMGTFLARLLGQRRMVSDPSGKTMVNEILTQILRQGYDPEEVIKAAKGVNFEDPNQVADFFRTFIQANAGDWADKLRYNSMLSSINTHIINMASNAQGTGVLAPIEKTIEGVYDAMASGFVNLFGGNRARTRYAGEGLAYAKGYYGSVLDAIKTMYEVGAGKRMSANPDTHSIRLTTSKSSPLAKGVEKALDVPGRALEAVDQFFITLTKSGLENQYKYRMDKGIKLNNLSQKSVEEASELLFRGKLVNKKEGMFSQALGGLAQVVNNARSHKHPWIRIPAKMTFPFVVTPTNVAKAGFERNPITGVINLIGNEDKIGAAAKLTTGAMATLMGVSFAMGDRLTAGEPTDPTRKQAFREAGKLPWSVKLPTPWGDQWVSYSKMHPVLGFQFGMVAGALEAYQEGQMTEDDLQVAMNATAKAVGFFADQTFIKNVGDFASLANGDIEAWPYLLGNYPQQFIPYRAFMGWLTRIVDPYQRKPDAEAPIHVQLMQRVMSGIPGLSDNVPVREGSYGQPIENQHRLLNAVSPYRISTENPEGMAKLKLMEERTMQNKLLKQQRDADNKAQDALDPRSMGEKGAAKQQDLEEEVKKNRIKLNQGGAEILDGKFAYWDDESQEVKEIDLTGFTKQKSGISKFDQEQEKYKAARKVFEAPLTNAEKEKAYKALGVSQEDVRYDTLANYTEETKTNYIIDQYGRMDRDTFLERLITGRENSLSGKLFLTNGVVDNLVDEGILSEDEGKALKGIKYNKKGQLVGSGSKKKKDYSLDVKVPKVDLPKTRLKLRGPGTSDKPSSVYAPFKTKRVAAKIKVPTVKPTLGAPAGVSAKKISPNIAPMSTSLSSLGKVK